MIAELFERILKKGFDESQVSRDPHGQFASVGTTSLGKEIKGVKNVRDVAAEHGHFNAKDHLDAGLMYAKSGNQKLADAHLKLSAKKRQQEKSGKPAKPAPPPKSEARQEEAKPAEKPATKKMPAGAEPPPPPTEGLAPPQVKAAPLTKSEDKALNDYQGADYRSINGQLREGKGLDAKVQAQVKNLNSAIAKQEVEHDTVVYRGIGGKNAEAYISHAARPGAVIEEKGFLSTTSSRSAADFFSVGNPSAIFHIKLPKGTPALSAEQHNSKRGVSGAEKEFILGSGTRMRVTRVERIDGDYHIHAERIE